MRIPHWRWIYALDGNEVVFLVLDIGATSTPYCTTLCPPRNATSQGRRCVGRAASELGDYSTCIGPTIRNGRASAVNELPTLHRSDGHTDIRYIGTEMLGRSPR